MKFHLLLQRHEVKFNNLCVNEHWLDSILTTCHLILFTRAVNNQSVSCNPHARRFE